MKLFLCLASVLILALPVRLFAASGAPFTIASETLPPLPEGTESQSALLRLKQQAVREYLQKVLGSRYEKYDAMITPDFAERYILDYQVNRQSSDSTQMEISGHLDVDALRQLVRVSETKALGSQTLKPLFVISATLPGMNWDPRQTAQIVKQSVLAQTIFKSLGDQFQKFNAVLAMTEDAGLGMARPPTRESEIRSLRSYGMSAGFNSVVWVNLSSCKGCGTRVDFHLYNLTQGRHVLSVSADVDLEASQMNDPKRLAKILGKSLSDFGSGFEESVSKGTLFAMEYKVIVEGLDSYKAFKQVDAALGKQDFVLLPPSVSHSTKGSAEFRILSPLQPRELFQRFSVAQFPGLTLRPMRIDSQTVTVRYLQ